MSDITLTLTNPVTQTLVLNGLSGRAKYALIRNLSDTTITLTASQLRSILNVENSNAVTVNLPSSGLVGGDWICIINTGAGLLTIDGGTQTIKNAYISGNTLTQVSGRAPYGIVNLLYISTNLWWTDLQGEFDVS